MEKLDSKVEEKVWDYFTAILSNHGITMKNKNWNVSYNHSKVADGYKIIAKITINDKLMVKKFSINNEGVITE